MTTLQKFVCSNYHKKRKIMYVILKNVTKLRNVKIIIMIFYVEEGIFVNILFLFTTIK